jgi:hypothetical protein
MAGLTTVRLTALSGVETLLEVPIQASIGDVKKAFEKNAGIPRFNTLLASAVNQDIVELCDTTPLQTLMTESASDVVQLMVSVRNTGFSRCEGPFTSVQARKTVTPSMAQAFAAEWAAASADFVELMAAIGMEGYSKITKDHLWPLKLRLHDLKGASWAELAEHGLVPASIGDYEDAEGGQWPLSADIAIRLLRALPHLPPPIADLQIAVSYFKLWEDGDEEECTAYLGYACGAAPCAFRDDNLFFRLVEEDGETQWATADVDCPWDQEDGEEADVLEWEQELLNEAQNELEGWVEWREDDEGFSITPNRAFTGCHGDEYPGVWYFDSEGVSDGNSKCCNDLSRISDQWNFAAQWPPSS